MGGWMDGGGREIWEGKREGGSLLASSFFFVFVSISAVTEDTEEDDGLRGSHPSFWIRGWSWEG